MALKCKTVLENTEKRINELFKLINEVINDPKLTREDYEEVFIQLLVTLGDLRESIRKKSPLLPDWLKQARGLE